MAVTINICKFCGETKPLIKAHIIPKCFQDAVKDDRNEMLILRTFNQSIVKTQDFLFDKALLCQECDNSFSHDENYTATLLSQIRSGKISPVQTLSVRGGQDRLYNVDQRKVKRCLLSILWRMSISKKDYFMSVDLGPLEIELKSRLNIENIMDQKFFPVTILSLNNSVNWKARMLCTDSPPLKFLGHRMYVLHLPNYLIMYHASKQVTFNPDNLSFRANGLINIGEETKGVTNIYLNNYYKSFPA